MTMYDRTTKPITIGVGPHLPTWPPYPTTPNYPPSSIIEARKRVVEPFYPVKSGTNGNLMVKILDNSSSMAAIRNQTQSGIDEFVRGQQNAPVEAGAAWMTLVTFNGEYVNTVYENVPVKNTPRHKYEPFGGTNLLDAIGITMHKVNTLLMGIPEAFRPGITIVIFTDGEENQSRYYTNEDIKSMVQLSENQNWTFTFFGANIDAFSVGGAFGMRHENTMQYSAAKIDSAFSVASASMLNTRSAKIGGQTSESLYNTMYSTEDRDKVV